MSTYSCTSPIPSGNIFPKIYNREEFGKKKYLSSCRGCGRKQWTLRSKWNVNPYSLKLTYPFLEKLVVPKALAFLLLHFRSVSLFPLVLELVILPIVPKLFRILLRKIGNQLQYHTSLLLLLFLCWDQLILPSKNAIML